MTTTTTGEWVTAATTAAAAGDAATFKTAITQLRADGWDRVSEHVGQQFVNYAHTRIGDGATLDAIHAHATHLHPYTSQVVTFTVYDIEFLIRGFAGATTLMGHFTTDNALTLSLALIGAWQATTA